nr:insecticidal protein IPD113.1 [Lygodium flexuosum]
MAAPGLMSSAVTIADGVHDNVSAPAATEGVPDVVVEDHGIKILSASAEAEVEETDVVVEQPQPVLQLPDYYIQVNADDWHNRIRSAILQLASGIPVVGNAVSILLGLFWPANRVNIFESIELEQYIRNIVKQEIFEFELRQHMSDIEALEDTVRSYDRAALREKGNFLTAWITQSNILATRLRNSQNNIHLLLHIVTVATLHMAALHERFTFGKELYAEDNTTNWQEDLVAAFRRYAYEVLPVIFRQWKSWRESQVQIETWTRNAQHGVINYRPASSHATVEDRHSGERFVFRRDGIRSTTIFLPVCEDHRTRMGNEAVADMASYISPTFAFHKLLPDDVQRLLHAYDEQQFGRVFRGPYSRDLLWNNVSSSSAIDFRSSTNRNDFVTSRHGVVEVNIRAGHHVDAIQFRYGAANSGNVLGVMAGNNRGGTLRQFDVRHRAIESVRMEFAQNILAAIQLDFDDGTTTRRLGNQLDWPTWVATCTTPFGYTLSSWAYRQDNGPYGTAAPSVLRFQYAPPIEP